MVSSFDPGALLSRVYTLSGDITVRLRLVQRRDEPAIRALLSKRDGREPEDFELMRIVRFDPRRLAICATALLSGTETLVGVGTIRLDQPLDEEPAPELLAVDSGIAEGLDELLRAALCGRARAVARGRAA